MTRTASGLSSISRERRPSLAATAPSVPEPANGSRHRSPGRELAWTKRRSSPSGFCVGYPVFSRPVGETIVCHITDVGRLP